MTTFLVFAGGFLLAAGIGKVHGYWRGFRDGVAFEFDCMHRTAPDLYVAYLERRTGEEIVRPGKT